MNIRKAATDAARIIRRGNRANVMADGSVWESVGPFGLIDNNGHQTHPVWYNRFSNPCQGLTIAEISRQIREALANAR